MLSLQSGARTARAQRSSVCIHVVKVGVGLRSICRDVKLDLVTLRHAISTPAKSEWVGASDIRRRLPKTFRTHRLVSLISPVF